MATNRNLTPAIRVSNKNRVWVSTIIATIGTKIGTVSTTNAAAFRLTSITLSLSRRRSLNLRVGIILRNSRFLMLTYCLRGLGTNDFVMLYNDQPAGSLAVSMARAAGLTGGAGSQALLELELEVDPSAQPGTSIPLSAALNVYDDQPSPIPVHVEPRGILVQ